MSQQRPNTTAHGARYAPERTVAAPVSGQFEVAVDLERGGRVTLFRPDLPGLDPESFLTVARAEIARCAPLRDTAYCTVRDAGIDAAGRPFLVLDRPLGHPLATLLRAQDHLRVDTALSLLIELCNPVERAHAVGIVPVPISLDAILLHPRPDGHQRVTLVDLALHRTPLAAAVPAPLRSSSFRSPQLVAGEVAEPRDDVFALSALLYLTLFGVMAPVMAGHGPVDGSGWPTLPSDAEAFDPRLEACLHTVLLKGLAPARGDRFRDVAALRRALVGLRQLLRLTAPAFEVLAATRGRLGRRPMPLFEDLPVRTPGLARAAEAHARIQAVVAEGDTSLSRLYDAAAQGRARGTPGF